MRKIYDSPAQAVADIRDGAVIMLAGFGPAGMPTRLVTALRDHGAKDLTIICNACGSPRRNRVDAAILIEAGLVKKAIVSVGLLPGSSLPAVEQQHASGSLKIELVPQGTLAERIRAGGAGIGGFYTRVGVGTVVAEAKELRTIDGLPYLLELPLRADYALLKARRGDTMGNLTYRRAAKNFNPIMAMAADVTIVEVEELVEPNLLDAEMIETPAPLIDRIVRPSGGAS